MAHRQDWSRKMAERGYALHQPAPGVGPPGRAPASGAPVVPNKAIGSTRFQEAHSKTVKAPKSSKNSVVELPAAVVTSGAVYQAFLPCRDVLIEKSVTSGHLPHVFAAVLTSDGEGDPDCVDVSRDYLQKHLYAELVKHVQMFHGDVEVAIRETLVQLDLHLRVQDGPLLAGTRLAAAYVDLARGRLHLASTGWCHAAVAVHDSAGHLQVAHEVGRPVPAVAPDRSRRPGRFSLSRRGSISSRGGAGSGAGSGGNTSARGPSRSVSRAAHVIPPAQAGLQTAVVPLTTAVDAIILGSRGFWREVPALQAALRVASIASEAPQAVGGNAAAAVAQLALQNVAARTSPSRDPRMACLSDTSTLQQLWVGSKHNSRFLGKQALRRRRGDVHGDLSVAVIRFDWAGDAAAPVRISHLFRPSAGQQHKHAASHGGHLVPRRDGHSSAKAAAHWQLVRAHFVKFRPPAAAAARQLWYAAVDAALLQGGQRRSATAKAAFAARALLSLGRRTEAAPAEEDGSCEAVGMGLHAEGAGDGSRWSRQQSKAAAVDGEEGSRSISSWLGVAGGGGSRGGGEASASGRPPLLPPQLSRVAVGGGRSSLRGSARYGGRATDGIADWEGSAPRAVPVSPMPNSPLWPASPLTGEGSQRSKGGQRAVRRVVSTQGSPQQSQLQAAGGTSPTQPAHIPLKPSGIVHAPPSHPKGSPLGPGAMEASSSYPRASLDGGTLPALEASVLGGDDFGSASREPSVHDPSVHNAAAHIPPTHRAPQL